MQRFGFRTSAHQDGAGNLVFNDEVCPTPNKRLDALLHRTVENLTIYVDGVAGSDVTGDGSAGAPYATPTKALSLVPQRIAHLVSVKIAPGTYTDFPRDLKFDIEATGQLTIEGTGDPIVVAGPFTTTAVTGTGAGGLSGTDLVVAGAGWATDQFFGKFVRYTSGAGAGYFGVMHYNSATTIETTPNFMGVALGDSFEVVSPSVIVNIDHPVSFDIRAPGYWGTARFGIANVAFNNTDDTPFEWRGHATGILCFCSLKVPTNENIFIWSGGSINQQGLFDASGFINPIYAVGWISALQLLNTDATWPTSPDWDMYVEPGDNSSSDGISINWVSLRTGIFVASPSVTLSCCALSHAKVDHRSRLYCNYCRCRPKSTYTGVTGVLIGDNDSSLEISDVHLDAAPRDGIYLTDFGKCIASNLSGNATRYGYHLVTSCRAKLNAGNTLTGTSANLYFARNASTPALPGAGASVNDTEDSFVFAA